MSAADPNPGKTKDLYFQPLLKLVVDSSSGMVDIKPLILLADALSDNWQALTEFIGTAAKSKIKMNISIFII